MNQSNLRCGGGPGNSGNSPCPPAGVQHQEVSPQQAARLDSLKGTFSVQRHAVKTPRDLARNVITLLVLDLIVLPVVCGGLLLVRAWAGPRAFEAALRNIGPLVGVGGAVLVVIILASPLYQLFLLLFRPRRSVDCPVCGVTHTIFRCVQSYVCTGCGLILRLSQGDTSALFAVHCPCCGAEWGSEAERTRCFVCGLTVIVREGAVMPAPPDIRCPRCDAEAQTGSYVCCTCGELLSQPAPFPGYTERPIYSAAFPAVNDDGMDLISLEAMPASGNMIKAFWFARAGCAAVDRLADKPPTWGEQWEVTVIFQSCLFYLNKMLKQMPKSAEAALHLRSLIQVRYARLLIGAMTPKTGPFDGFAVTNFNELAILGKYRDLLKQLVGAEAEQRSLLSTKIDAWVVPEVWHKERRLDVTNAVAVRKWTEATAPSANTGTPEAVRIPLEFLKVDVPADTGG